MRKWESIVAAALILAAGASVACAQAGRNAVERRQDRRQLRQDRLKQADDTRGLIRIRRVKADYDAARRSGDRSALAGVDRRVLLYLKGEIGESNLESLQAAAEVRRDKVELGSDRREIRRNRALGAPPRVRADDHRDLRDDRRDLRDDRRDLAREMRTRRRLFEIRREWKSLEGKFDARSLERRDQLFAEILTLAGVERVENRKEIRENKRELREDRRETREDRRQP